MKQLPPLLLATVALSFLGQAHNTAQEHGATRNPSSHLVLPFHTVQEDIVSRADELETQGRFKEAAALLSKALGATDLSVSQRKTLEFELDRLERVKKCFPFDRAGLFEALGNSVAGLSTKEFEQWAKDERFESRQIDGEQRFMASSVSNLFFRYPELQPRRRPHIDTAELERHYWASAREIKKTALEQKQTYVLPKRFQVIMTVIATAEAAPAGKIIRAWLPIPRRYPNQIGFELVSAAPTAARVDDPESTIRCVYLEQAARVNRPVDFKIEYQYTRYATWFDFKPEAVRPWDAGSSELRKFVQEGPHVVFTAEMRELSQQIVGRETNAFRKAKTIYDWISDRIKYSYSNEYSTYRNIGDHCRNTGYGDCGQEAFLFITLCRLNGIPARWQSGWNTFPGAKNLHDWSEIYLAPYGWIPVDPYMGVFAMRYATTLSLDQQRELRDFYFGGLDQYRMAANSDHCQDLTPPKQSMRSDNVDFQRGELEYDTHNIYFDQYSYELDLKEVKPVVSPTEPRGR